MLGNDVVDLEDVDGSARDLPQAASIAGSSPPKSDERSRPTPRSDARCAGLIGRAKEAAYKLAPQDGARLRLLTDPLRGRVRSATHAATRMPPRISNACGRVMPWRGRGSTCRSTFGTPAGPRVGDPGPRCGLGDRATCVVGLAATRRPGSRSRRRVTASPFASSRRAARWPSGRPPRSIAWRSSSGDRIPELRLDGAPIGLDLSLSHHGRVVAFASRMPSLRQLERLACVSGPPRFVVSPS